MQISQLQVNQYRDKIDQISTTQQLTVFNGKTIELVPVRIPLGKELCVIDAVNCTFRIEDYVNDEFSRDETTATLYRLYSTETTQEEKDLIANEIAFDIATDLGDIFGSDFTHFNRKPTKLHGYTYHYTIGADDNILGKLCFGNNDNTVLLMITGTGCAYAHDHWEYSFYDYLKSRTKGKITRIDIAHDDMQGDYSGAEHANEAESQDAFCLSNRRPSVAMLGDWKYHNGEGRTLQVGKRENGKMYRGYEKGKKFGDKESPWFRSEVEFKNKDRFLPLEMLISPTEYFVGAYPYCYEVIESAKAELLTRVTRLPTAKKEMEITFKKAISITKKQFGKYIKVFRDILQDDTAVLDLIETDKLKDYFPKRLKLHEKFMTNPPSYAPWADQPPCAIPLI